MGRRAVLCLLAAAVPFGCATRLQAHSFAAPFEDVDSAGNRQISSIDWSIEGHAVVNQHFIRLTPDRQSKRGAIWSNLPLNVERVLATLKFRISGQAKKFFGDGIALWFVKEPSYPRFFNKRGEELHGGSSSFEGVAIIFDTFKNAEALEAHRDVTVLFNDGTRTRAQMTEVVEGCDANVRFHEERGDFSVSSHARAKVIIDTIDDPDGGGEPVSRLTVAIDPADRSWADGDQWTDPPCVSIRLPFAPGWVQHAHVGLTATTGQLADNHDVLSLELNDDWDEHFEMEAALKNAPKFKSQPELGVSEERMDRIEGQLDRLLRKLDFLEHHFEHEMAAADDHVQSTVGKLREAENDAAERIGMLEKKIVATVSDSMTGRLDALERSVTGRIKRAVTTNSLVKLDRNLTSSIQQKVSSMGAGWRRPFFFIMLVQGAAAYYAWKWWKKFKKTHML